MALFMLRFDSWCGACDALIEAGDNAGEADDEVVCEACYEETEMGASSS